MPTDRAYPFGGGALSGKDLYKADRAGAIIASRLAKLVVMTGVAAEYTATLALFPGDTEARIVSLRTGVGSVLDVSRWATLLDLRIESVGDRWTNAQDLVDVARHGHFVAGRAWECPSAAPITSTSSCRCLYSSE